jgi:flavodoxin
MNKIRMPLKTILFTCIFFCILSLEAQDTLKTGIVYLSRTNNTKAVAEMIHIEVGGDLIPLELQNPYPANYNAAVTQVSEENESGFLPPLKIKIELAQYDTIFLGFPTWGMQLPPPVKSFLNDYNLTGKTVIPFNTHAGYGLGSSLQTIGKLCPNSTILEVFSIKGGIERDGVYLYIKEDRAVEVKSEVKNWLQKIGVQR